MLSDRGDSQLEPVVLMLSDVLAEIELGQIRVPAFQRPFVWRPEQMLDLFDSIERGYPIGSLLLWETAEDVASLDEVGEVPIDSPRPGRPVAYVLDGHQRLSTLFGVLRRHGRAPLGLDQREWKWRIYRDLDPKTPAERYRHHRAQGSPPAPVPLNYLPMRSVNSTMDFLRFSRNLEMRLGDVPRLERLINEAERVAQRILGYKITLVRLRGANLTEAVDVYTRLNRRGVRMEADQVVSALTHRRNQPRLSEGLDGIVESVVATGFGELPRMALFRSVLAISGEPDVMSPRWEKIADRIQNRLVDAVPATFDAVHRAVALLRHAGLPLANLLPYSHQLVLLTTFFHCRPEPTGHQRLELERWFWGTSWAGSFAGANSTRIREGLAEMRAFAKGQTSTLKVDVESVQPMPEPFNLNSARTLAYVAWEAHEFPKRLDPLGSWFDVVDRLAGGAPQAYRQIVPGDSSAANRLILPTSPGVTPLAALKELRNVQYLSHGFGQSEPPATVKDLLDSHGIPMLGWHRLVDGHTDIFLSDRTAFLQDRLRAFAKGLGVQLGADMTGVADNDTEHDE